MKTDTTNSFQKEAELFEAELLDAVSAQRGGNLVITPPHAVRDIIAKAIEHGWKDGMMGGAKLYKRVTAND